MKLFYECPICGNIIVFENFSGNVPTCCGSEMERLVPGTAEGTKDKHIPQCKLEEHKLKVTIGDPIHPATSGHFIEWIALETNHGYYQKTIPIGHEPRACFHLGKEEYPITVYTYCNLHGLWDCNL